MAVRNPKTGRFVKTVIDIHWKYVKQEIAKYEWEQVEPDREERRFFIGTVTGLMPSGSLYAPWSPVEEWKRQADAEAMERLEKAAEKHGFSITTGEGDGNDLFVVESRDIEKCLVCGEVTCKEDCPARDAETHEELIAARLKSLEDPVQQEAIRKMGDEASMAHFGKPKYPTPSGTPKNTKFIVWHDGDPSVGFCGMQAEVEITCLPEEIPAQKEALKEVFSDLWDFDAHCMTEEELAVMTKAEHEDDLAAEEVDTLSFFCGCPDGAKVTIRKNWSGPTPKGGVVCPTGKHVVGFDGMVFPHADAPKEPSHTSRDNYGAADVNGEEG